MDRLTFPKSRIAKIMDLATSDMANMRSQDPSEAEIERTEQNKNTNEDGYGYHVREPIEGLLPEKYIESPVPTINEHQNPISSENSTEMAIDNKNMYKTNVNAFKNLLDDLRDADSSTDGDFGSSSIDDYICGTDESSSSTDDVRTPVKKRSKITARNNVTVPDTPSPINASTSENAPSGCSFWKSNGINSSGKKKKTRKSEKERRQDRVKRKLFRNTGLEYTTTSGKTKKSRELRDLDNCRKKCKERLALHLRKNVFDTYWSLGSYEKRIEYMAKCIEVCRKKTSKSSPKKKRNVSFRYFIQSSNHTKYLICKGCLLKTFDESHRYLQTVCEKLRNNGGHLPPRKRRVESNPKGKELRDEAYLEHYTLKTVAEDEPLSLIKNPTHTDSETDSCSIKSEYEEFEEVICKKENDKEETTDCIDDIDNRNINNTDKTIKIEKIEENDTDSEEMRPYEDVNTNIHIKHEMIVKTEAYEEHGIDIEEMQLEFAVNTSDNTKLQIKDDNNDSNLETDLVPDAPTRKRKTAK